MKLLVRLSLILCVFHFSHASAGIITDSSSGDITGVTGIDVLGVSYDVTLNEELTDWSDSGVGNFDWPFALAASSALLDIFKTGYLSGGSYDLNPASAFGCELFHQCNWFTAVGINYRSGGRDATGTVFTNFIDSWSADTSTHAGAPTTADYNTDYTNITFLTWTESQAVPEPSALYLLGIGLLGIFARRTWLKT